MGRGFIALAAAVAFSVSADAAEPITDCQPKDGLEPICVVQGSEDLAVLPGGKALLISESRLDLDGHYTMVWKPGQLSLLDLETRKARALYPLADQRPGRGGWGDAACPGEIGAALSPHGLHLSRRPDGQWQLLVVNHGGRESVEMFEVRGRGDRLRLSWRGCVPFPSAALLNDVAALPAGGFVVTTMLVGDGPDRFPVAVRQVAQNVNTGFVWRWQPDQGSGIVGGTVAPMPNGVEVSRDGTVIFVAVGGSAGKILKIDLGSGNLLGAADVRHPDNVSWTADGRLLAAFLPAHSDVGSCLKAGFRAPCGAAFGIAAIDPGTMAAAILLEHEGPPMGAATGVVEVGGDLYIGSAAGDRILKAPGAARAP